MLTRRALALYTIVSLLFGLLALPQGPQLVCRRSGMPMPPVVAASASRTDARGSCCDVAVSVRPDGVVRYALTSPGCCELRSGFQRTTVPTVTPPAPEFPASVLAAVPSSAPVPCLVAAISSVPVARESAPRAPPIRSASPRAPPRFS